MTTSLQSVADLEMVGRAEDEDDLLAARVDLGQSSASPELGWR